jgi:hypothetical protein
MRFDTAGLAGDYEVVIFTLSFSPEEQSRQPTRRRQSVLHLHMRDNAATDSIMDAQ